MSATKLDYALAYAEVLPGKLLPVVQMGKKPVIGAWQKDASNDPVMLNQWFRGKANIGWMPNHEYFVLDVDMKLDKHGRNGFGTLAQWESKHGPLPTTLSATTPTGGKHLIFRLPPGKVGKTFSGSVLKSPAHGIDIRASGTGQVVIEPSERHEGRYSWDNWRPLEGPPPEIAEAPSWLVAFATGEDRGSVKDDKGVPKGAGRAMLVTEGGRNSALVSEAGRLRRVGYEFEAMVAALRALNKSQFSPPLPESEVVTVAKWECESHEPTEGATLVEQQSGEDYQAEIEEADGAEEMLDIVRRLQLDTGGCQNFCV